MAITCCGRKVKCYSRRICGDWEPEYQNLRDTSVLLFASGVLGLLCATCAIALPPSSLGESSARSFLVRRCFEQELRTCTTGFFNWGIRCIIFD